MNDFRIDGKRLTWNLPRVLGRAQVSEWLELSTPASESVLVLGRLSRIEPGVDFLLQGAINLLRRSDHSVLFSVPPLTFSGSRGHASVDGDLGPRTSSEKILGETIAGLALSLLCDPADDHANRVVRWQRDRTDLERGYLGVGAQSSFVELSGFSRTMGSTNRRVWHLDGRESVSGILYQLVSTVLGKPFAEAAEKAVFGSWTDFAYEAFQNTRSHGSTSLSNTAIKSIRFITLRRHPLTELVKAHQVGPGPQQSMARYLEELAQAGHRRVVELVIGDGGVGVPARLARSMSIYEAFPDAEAALVAEAMWPGVTTDDARAFQAGEGFRRMLRATARLGGRMEIRTGRHEFSRAYRPGDAHDFTDSTRSNPAFALQKERPQQLIAGTAVSLLLPAEIP